MPTVSNGFLQLSALQLESGEFLVNGLQLPLDVGGRDMLPSSLVHNTRHYGYSSYNVVKHAFVLLVLNFGRCNFKSSDVLNIMMTVVLKHINIIKISKTNQQMH